MKKAVSLLLAVLLCASVIVPVHLNFAGTAPDDGPTYSFFGEEIALEGSWTQDEAENVGRIYLSSGETSAELSRSIKDFALDFKLKAPANAVSPLSVFLRSSEDGAYCFTVNPTAGAGVSFGDGSGTEFSDASLNLADGKWHSVGIKLRAQRAVLLIDGVKVMDRELTRADEAGGLSLSVSQPGVAVSGIRVAGVKAEDMDTVAAYDFSTDTYPNALPGVNWTYDTSDGINGIKNGQSWSTWKIVSASGDSAVKELAKVKEFALEIKVSLSISGGNAWQRGLQYNLPNGSNIYVNKENLRYYQGGTKISEKANANYPDTQLHTFDLVFTGEKIRVYMDKALTPIYEFEHNKAADTANFLSVYNYFDSGSVLKIHSLTVKTGKGVHELVVEKPAPNFTAGSSAPTYKAFGNSVALSGEWTSWEGENVGASFRAAAANSVVLSENLQNFGLDFKVCAPAETTAPFAVLMREAGGRSYEFTVNQTEESGISFGGYSEAAFSDASLKIGDGQWHSVSLRMRGGRAVVLIDGVKVMDRTLSDAAASGALVLKVNEIGTYFSAITLYNVKAEDMDTVADYDFSTDTYPNALPGVDWTYDTADGVNGITNGKSWVNWQVASASKDSAVQELAKVKEFALEIKVSMSLEGANAWQRGLWYNLPNGQTLSVCKTIYRYYADKTTPKDFANYPDAALHTFDIVFTDEKVLVYMDKALAPTFELEHNTAADAAAYFSVYNYFDSGSVLKINSLKLKTGAGVHELVVEKPAPEMTENSSVSPYYSSFGSPAPLAGAWKCFDAKNVGIAFRTVSGGEVVLGNGLKNVAVDFKAIIPDEAIDAFSVLLRKNGASAYELGFNKTDGSGVTFTGPGMTAFGDSTLNVTDGQWHNFSVRLLENRAVILIDGIRIADRVLSSASAGEVALKINAADINFSDIRVYVPAEDDMNELADYDFSTDSYGSVIPGINWAYDTALGGVSGMVTSDFEYTGKLQSASKSDEVQALAKTRDFAMELKFLLDINDPNAWQRGLSVNLPNGHSFDILGGIFRYDRDNKNGAAQKDHDTYLGAKEQVMDIVYQGGLLTVYINKGRDAVYSLKTEAPSEAGLIGFFTYLPKGDNKIKLTSLVVRTGNGVHDPAFSPYVKTTESIFESLIKEGWKYVPGGIAATEQSGYNKPYSGWSAKIAVLDDFIFDFTVQFKEDETQAMAIDCRYNLYDDHNEGYPLQFYPRKLVISKYNDNNFQRAELQTVIADFTKPTKVRITAHDNELWIAINGVREVKIDDARDIIGQLRLAHSASMLENGVTLTDVALYHYDEQLANSGIGEPDTSGVKVIADYSVKSQKEAESLFYGRFDYEKYNGKDAICFSEQGKNRENVIHPNKVDSFVMTFYLNMDECNDINKLTLNLRKSYDSERNYGFSLSFSKKSVQLSESTAGSFSSSKQLGSAQIEMEGWVPVKIVANGKTVAVFVNNEFVLLRQTNETAAGFISCNNNLTGAANIYLSDILLTEYYEGAIPANAVPKAPPPRFNKDKTSEHKVNLSAAGKIEADVKETKPAASGLTALQIVLICIAAAVAAAAGVTVFLIIKKRRKKTN